MFRYLNYCVNIRFLLGNTSRILDTVRTTFVFLSIGNLLVLIGIGIEMKRLNIHHVIALLYLAGQQRALFIPTS